MSNVPPVQTTVAVLNYSRNAVASSCRHRSNMPFGAPGTYNFPFLCNISELAKRNLTLFCDASLLNKINFIDGVIEASFFKMSIKINRSRELQQCFWQDTHRWTVEPLDKVEKVNNK